MRDKRAHSICHDSLHDTSPLKYRANRFNFINYRARWVWRSLDPNVWKTIVQETLRQKPREPSMRLQRAYARARKTRAESVHNLRNRELERKIYSSIEFTIFPFWFYQSNNFQTDIRFDLLEFFSGGTKTKKKKKKILHVHTMVQRAPQFVCLIPWSLVAHANRSKTTRGAIVQWRISLVIKPRGYEGNLNP